MVVMLEASLKALVPIVNKVGGIVIVVSPVHNSKHCCGMSVMVERNGMSVNKEHPLNDC